MYEKLGFENKDDRFGTRCGFFIFHLFGENRQLVWWLLIIKQSQYNVYDSYILRIHW